MLLHNETYFLQQKLANYCRDGNLIHIDGTRKDRLPHYRRLIYNVINDALETAYPITKQILPGDKWDSLVYDFFKNQEILTPVLWKMPFIFYEYCFQNNIGQKLNHPYLDDLLYFEWIEIEVYNMPDRDIPAYKAKRNLLDNKIIVNPEHEIVMLEYPVFKMPASELEKNKGEYFLLVYREQENLSVRFFEMSKAMVWLFENMRNGKKTGREILQEAGHVLNLTKTAINELSDSLFQDLLDKGIILGAK